MSGRSRRGNHEGAYVTRRDGRIEYRVMVDGRRVSTYGRTKREAKAKADERIAILGDQRADVTVERLLEEWVTEGARAHRLSQNTSDQYASLLRGRVLPLIGSRRVDGLTRRVMAETMRSIDGPPSTRRSTYAALVKILEYAKDRGIVGTNVMRDVKRPQRADADARDITTAEAIAILDAASGHRWEVAAWLGLGAGLRRGEMLGLRWADVDLDEGRASITGNVTRTSAGLRRGEPKTRRGRRSVPLARDVAEALRAHRRSQVAEQLRAGAAWSDSGHVLTNEVGGIGEPRTLSRVWRSWARAAGVGDSGTHIGRHFAATTLLSSGRASVADVAAMLGHDPAVLLTVYAAAVADGQRAAADALGDVLTRGSRGPR